MMVLTHILVDVSSYLVGLDFVEEGFGVWRGKEQADGFFVWAAEGISEDWMIVSGIDSIIIHKC